jgi:5-guanidino-2-oxopentanoate decarboxylase
MSTQHTVGQYLVELLAANGIDTVFGIPGVHNLELYRGLDTTGLRHVLVRHEQGAVFAADGYARATGRPAAAFVISGPGLTNALTAIGQAYSDSVPVLIVASTPARDTLGKGWGVLHELPDQGAIAAGVTGLARTAIRAQDVRDHVRAAWATLCAPRPRPAYVGVPLDLLAEPTALEAERLPTPAVSLQPDAAAIGRAVELLNAAHRPLIIAGGGARNAGGALQRLAEALDAYLVTTAAGKGVIAESHPACLGASLPYPPTQRLVAAADVVLAVGTELSDSDVYEPAKLPIPGRLIRIDVDPVKLTDHYAADLPLLADARLALDALAAGVRPRTGWRSQSGPGAAHRERIHEASGAVARACDRAIRALRAGLPADAVLFTDMTQIAYHGAFAFEVAAPACWHAPVGYGALGYALPAAVGAKIGAPERPIVALAGDFGLQFTIAELMTAVEARLSLPIVLWNNDALGQIRDDMGRAGIGLVGVIARNPDFLALARACGAHAVRADAHSLAPALHAALEHPGPTLIECHSANFAA